jgi:hypothetical protein
MKFALPDEAMRPHPGEIFVILFQVPECGWLRQEDNVRGCCCSGTRPSGEYSFHRKFGIMETNRRSLSSSFSFSILSRQNRLCMMQLKIYPVD